MSLFTDGLDWVAGAADELLGYANSYTAAGPMLPGSVGPVTSFLSDAYDVVDWVQSSGVGKGISAYMDATEDKSSFEAPQMTAPTARAPAGSSNFRASDSAPMKVGLADQRVQNAWNRVRQSNNPSINAAMEYVRPTIRSSGPITSLSSASISRRKKKD